MLDALDLSECLTGGGFQNIHDAIADYEKRLLSRAALFGQEALEGIRDFAAPSDESVQKLIEQLSQNANNHD